MWKLLVKLQWRLLGEKKHNVRDSSQVLLLAPKHKRERACFFIFHFPTAFNVMSVRDPMENSGDHKHWPKSSRM